MWSGAGSGLLISLLNKLGLFFFYRSSNSGGTDVKMDGPFLEEKSSFKILGLFFSTLLDWASGLSPGQKK